MIRKSSIETQVERGHWFSLNSRFGIEKEVKAYGKGEHV
jgi:hypothetical protein